MIITTKLPIQNVIDLDERLKLYNSIVRFSYNRFKEGFNQKEIRKLIKDKFPLSESWFSQNAILEGKGYFDKDKNKTVVFGGKHNLLKRQHNKITNEQWKQSRLFPISIQGEKLQKGNRLMDLSIEYNNSILIKFNKNDKIEIQLPRLHKTIKKKLIKLEHLSKEKQCPIGFRIDNNFIYLIYDDSLLYTKTQLPKNKNLICGIDMNPNHIGISICKINPDTYMIDKIIHKETIDLTELNKKGTNKKKHETIQICKHIESLCVKFGCETLSMEELSVKSKNHKKGKRFNKLINNDWIRKLFSNNMKKRCENNEIEFIEVNPAYSSTIGNLCHDSVDEVNSATEIARRGSCKYVKHLCLYPNLNSIKHQWKDVFIQQDSWKDIHNELKNSKVKYRVPLDDSIVKSNHHLVSRKSFINLYIL